MHAVVFILMCDSVLVNAGAADQLLMNLSNSGCFAPYAAGCRLHPSCLLEVFNKQQVFLLRFLLLKVVPV